MGGPRILLLDIETAPNLSWVWGRWEQNVIDVKTHWYILCFAYKWYGEKRIYKRSLPDYPRYTRDREDDRDLVQDLWRVLNEADIVIAHNVNFDVKKSYARFLFHKLKPCSPFKTFDTLIAARKFFKFDSNKLDDLGSILSVGRKLPHTGKHLWLSCMEGKKGAWDHLTRYNAHDVLLLERVYERLKPWATNHPNLNTYTRKQIPHSCPSCQSTHLIRRGLSYARSLVYQRYLCKDCGSWHQGERVKKS